MYDRVSGGEPAVVIDKALFREDGSVSWEPFTQNIGQNYIADRILDDLKKIRAEFLTIVGIPNANTSKRERLNLDEVNSNNVETEILADSWLENLREGIEQTKELFGLEDLSVSLRFPHSEEGGIKDVPTSENKLYRIG